MSLLTLIRHGQASFLEEEYDQLSPAGIEQARLLGDYLARNGNRFDTAFTGPRARQIHTAQIVAEVHHSAGVMFPEFVQIPELDEYSTKLFAPSHLPALIEEFPWIENLEADYQRASGYTDKVRTFQKLFEAVMDLWLHEKIGNPEIESWEAFRQRIGRAIERMTAGEGRGRHVIAFTSGGPTAVAVQRALSIPHKETLQLSWLLKNSAINQFLFTKGRFSLSVFNATPHLSSREMITYW
jgi:broad specificity phosphatase PhoE